ncbi:MAG TPA: hypothetical protein VLF90_02700 [Patescibacteria group bacterium]|nr:hypothetical protein [Patescibacteria group bacterium]
MKFEHTDVEVWLRPDEFEFDLLREVAQRRIIKAASSTEALTAFQARTLVNFLALTSIEFRQKTRIHATLGQMTVLAEALSDDALNMSTDRSVLATEMAAQMRAEVGAQEVNLQIPETLPVDFM